MIVHEQIRHNALESLLYLQSHIYLWELAREFIFGTAIEMEVVQLQTGNGWYVQSNING